MNQVAYAPTVQIPKLKLPAEDGEPLESSWHRAQINLLIELIRTHWRDRTDFYADGNMFVYYSELQARQRNYRGPDFFVVLDVDGSIMRESWIVWEENGRYPDVIVELMSPTTRVNDLTTKKDLYARTFHTQDYFCYDPDTEELLGWRLVGNQYVPLESNAEGWLWSEALGLWLGKWRGKFLHVEATWLRFYDEAGNLTPLEAELERQRAEAAEAELARLRERLRALGIPSDEV